MKPAIGVYGEDFTVMRSFKEIEAMMYIKKTILQKCKEAESEGRKAKMLVIGAGAGRIIYELQEEFSNLDLAFINKENIQLHEDPKEAARLFVNYLAGEADYVATNKAEDFLQYFTNNVIIHDANERLPFEEREADFDIALVSSYTIEYIEKKIELLSEVKRVLRKNGVGFIALYYYPDCLLIGPDLITTSAFFNNTAGECIYNYRENDSLKIINKYPQKDPFSLLKLAGDSDKCDNSWGRSLYFNKYEIIKPSSHAIKIQPESRLAGQVAVALGENIDKVRLDLMKKGFANSDIVPIQISADEAQGIREGKVGTISAIVDKARQIAAGRRIVLVVDCTESGEGILERNFGCLILTPISLYKTERENLIERITAQAVGESV